VSGSTPAGCCGSFFEAIAHGVVDPEHTCDASDHAEKQLGDRQEDDKPISSAMG
jgi:hypothetical protein